MEHEKKKAKMQDGKDSCDMLCDGSCPYRLALRVVLKAASGLTPKIPEVVWLVRRSVYVRHGDPVSRHRDVGECNCTLLRAENWNRVDGNASGI
jgi:hypothetical protein